MSKLSNLFRRPGIQTKLVFYFSALILLAVTIVSVSAYSQMVKAFESLPENTAHQIAMNFRIRMVILGSTLSIALITLSYLLARQITRPLRALLSAAGRIAAGDLNITIPLVSTDELGILAQTINKMTDAIRGILTGLDYKLQEQKQNELEREKLIAELEARNAELTQFTYTVSHDLKSPLVTINGYLSYIEQDAASGNTERLKQDIQRIQEAARKMHALLTELIELSRIGRVINAPENIPFESLVQDAMDIVHGQLETHHVTVQTQPNLPIVYGDHQRLTEVLQNLLDNAVKYMGDQPVPLIEIGARKEEDKIVYFVKDNGTGIDAQYHKRIFGLFDKLDATSEGTGIGLALVKRIIETHGGKIWVESEGLGKGSTFFFTLPKSPEPRLSQD